MMSAPQEQPKEKHLDYIDFALLRMHAMQELLACIAVVGAALFLVRRVWRFTRRPDTISCGCGCSGCDERVQCVADSKASLPMYKP